MKILVCHCWLQEFFIVKVLKHGHFGQNPIAAIRVELIGAFPNLEFFVHHPDAVVFQGVRLAI
jgi:hypothetical protein